MHRCHHADTSPRTCAAADWCSDLFTHTSFSLPCRYTHTHTHTRVLASPALHMACANGHLSIANLLLEANAVGAHSTPSRPADTCLDNPTVYLLHAFVIPRMYQPITQHSCCCFVWQVHSCQGKVLVRVCCWLPVQDPEVKNADGNTPLHWACLNGHTQVTRMVAWPSGEEAGTRGKSWWPGRPEVI